MTTQSLKTSAMQAVRRRSLILAACWVGLLGPAAAQDDLWRARAQIYGWLPVPGSLERAGGTETLYELAPRRDVGETGRSRFGLVADNMYLNLDSTRGALRDAAGPLPLAGVSVGAESGMRLRGSTWTLAGSYTAIETARYDVQTLAGLRYFRTDSAADPRSFGSSLAPAPYALNGGPTVRPDVWDAILGVRGRVKLGDGRWFAPYYLDVGTGQSDFTWQAFGGIGYAFSWGEIVGSYRYLDYNFSPGSGLRDLSFSGPTISFGFRW